MSGWKTGWKIENTKRKAKSGVNRYVAGKMKLEFRVLGIPRPGGSKTAFFSKKLGRALIVDACKTNKQWRDSVAGAAARAMGGRELFSGPLYLFIEFFMPRPKGHFGTGKHAGELKPAAPRWCPTKPDASKLTRSTEDSLHQIVWLNDAQVVKQYITKTYANPNERPGARIVIMSMEETGDLFNG
jgi:Holliday junction resolvase RusA-like endonuclease